MDTKTTLPQLTGHDPLDVFRNHLNPNIQQALTPTQADRMAEYRFVLGYITNGSTLQNAVKILQSEYKLTQGTAYRRVQETFHIFGDFLKSEKSAKKVIYIEWLEKVFADCLESAKSADGDEAKIKYLTVADGYIKTLIKLQELDKTSTLPKTRDKTKPINIIFTTGPVPDQREVTDIPFDLAPTSDEQ